MVQKANKNIEVTESIKKTENTQNASVIVEKSKTEKCKVLLYNEKTKELDINFKGYGIRLNNADNINSEFVSVKYCGEIGKPNFSCKL